MECAYVHLVLHQQLNSCTIECWFTGKRAPYINGHVYKLDGIADNGQNEYHYEDLLFFTDDTNQIISANCESLMTVRNEHIFSWDQLEEMLTHADITIRGRGVMHQMEIESAFLCYRVQGVIDVREDEGVSIDY